MDRMLTLLKMSKIVTSNKAVFNPWLAGCMWPSVSLFVVLNYISSIERNFFILIKLEQLLT